MLVRSAIPLLVFSAVLTVRGQSALDGFNPGAFGNTDPAVFALASQADGKILVGGRFDFLGGGTGDVNRENLGRVNPDGTVDTSFNPGANNYIGVWAVQPDGKILVGGAFTMLGGGGLGNTTRNYIGRLNPDGSLDTSFNPGANAQVIALAVQPDGKILVGGDFTTLGGQPRNHLGRLNPNGTVDTSFNPGPNGSVSVIALQPDGKILVGGDFSFFAQGEFHNLARLNPDGTVDLSFGHSDAANPIYPDDPVTSIAVQPDGKIIIGGDFDAVGNPFGSTTLRQHIARLNSDSTVDVSFDPGANNTVLELVLQPDGKILVAGFFVTLGGGGAGTTTHNYIGRLNPDGTLDTSFNPGANQRVTSLLLQADGNIVVGGFFTALNRPPLPNSATTRNYIGRLTPGGFVDRDFNPGTNNGGFVGALAVQADGKVLVGGGFTTLGGSSRNHIGRLNPDDTLDSFNPGANGSVNALAVQADGKILVGGQFTTLGGGGTGTSTRNSIGRLNADGTLDTFNPGANGAVGALAVQPDGKILVGGNFTTLGGSTRNFIGRLNLNGTLDNSFTPGSAGGEVFAGVYTLAVQADGKILVGGDFTTLGGGPRNNIARLNSDGTLDSSFNPGANNAVVALVVQPDGKILVGGGFTILGGGTRNNIGRLNPDGSLDPTFDLGASGAVQALALQTDAKIFVVGDSIERRFSNGALDPSFDSSGTGSVFALALQADGKLVVGGQFSSLRGQPRNNIGRLLSTNPNPQNRTLDTTFNPGADSSISTLAVQADGKILVGGVFTTLGGGTRNRIGRVNSDGSLDASFDPNANNSVEALAVQADNKILVGGFFTSLGGSTRNEIGRLNPNGSLDISFNPGASGLVRALAVQTDGKIVAGGAFTSLGGSTRNRIGRLNPDGALDTTFDPGADALVTTLALQADGKVLAGGLFSSLGGSTRNHIGRLNSNGALDSTFDPGADGLVSTLALQADGKILVGGDFSALGGGTRNFIGRLNPNGTLDTSFNPGANGQVRKLAVQADGKIIVGGSFTTLGGGTRNRVGRLNPDGSLDTSFNPGANDFVNTLVLQPDGAILAGGNFTTFGGGGTGTTARSRIARLTHDAPLQKLRFGIDDATIFWDPRGAAPEAHRVSFELSTDGINYNVVGYATHITDGWQFTNYQLPTNQNIFLRARAFYSTGGTNGSESITESVLNAFISPPPTPANFVSRKTHGAAGGFDINLPQTGSIGVECRSGGANGDHQVLVTFPTTVTFNTAAVTSGTGTVSNSAGSGTNTLTINLTGVTNAQKLTTTLVDVSNGSNRGNLNVQMGVLLGDTTGNGSVTGTDVSQTKLQSGQPVSASNFRSDVIVSGSINGTDVSSVKLKSGTALPP